MAGTSPAVVSYVFNHGPRGVAAATRDRVLAAAEELGYEPTPAARAAAARVPTVGLVLPSLQSPYYAEVARAVGAAATASDRVLMVAEAHGPGAREARVVQTMIEHKVDGVIVVALEDQPRLAPVLRFGLPVVELFGLPDHRPEWSCVSIDYARAAALAVGHLLQHGYESIGMLNLPASPSARQHRHGFDQAIAEYGPRVRSVHWRCEASGRAVAEVAAEVLRRPDRPRAIYCATQVHAAVLLHTAQRLGIAVPTELAVVGFDGSNGAEPSHPPLTAVREPFDELGAEAVRLLGGRRPEVPVSHVVLGGELTIRRSCGCGVAAKVERRR